MELSPQKLRAQYGEKGIYAGASHFKDYWARDSLFACFGALALKDYKQVENTLNHFLFNLRDGHVPLRTGAKNEVLRYLGLPTKEAVVHEQDKGINESIDGNSLLLIVAEKFDKTVKKKEARKEGVDGEALEFSLKQVQEWIDRNTDNNVLVEEEYASWEDSLKLEGARLYSNVCYYRSLLAAAHLFKDEEYTIRAQNTKKEIQKWWKEEYFSDGPNRDVLMSAGNLLAIVWGVATTAQAKKIILRLAKRKTVCPQAGYFQPTTKEVYTPFFLIGLSDYHAKMEWSWLAALEIAAYHKIGNTKEAKRRQAALEKLFKEHGEVYEVYENNKPVRRLIYKSEKNFAWTLGVYFAAIKNQL